MDLREHLLRLIDLLPGAELDGARLVGVSSELGLRYVFELGGRTLFVEVSLAEHAREYAAREGRLCWSYRADADADAASVDSVVGLRLCRALAARSTPRQAEVLAAIACEAAAARAAEQGSLRVREVRCERILELAGPRDQRYLTLSPYVGCLIGCRFCYAQTRLHEVRRLEQLPEVPWGSWVDVRIDAARALARELPDAPRVPVKFCPIVSDPYQVVEARYRLVRACLEVLRDEQPPRPVLVLTRSRAIENDLDVLAAMPRAFAGLSIPTIDDDVRRHFEPRGASIPDRLTALGKLRAAGIRTFAMVQPLLPGSVDDLADALAAVAGSVRIDVLHDTFGAAPDFADPRYAAATGDAWQRDHADALAAALTARGVPIWPGELPVELYS